jgi:hypothetical protein
MSIPRLLSLTPPLTSASASPAPLPQPLHGNRPGSGAAIVAVVRAGAPQADLPADLTNPLVIATIVTDAKAYVLPEVLAAFQRLRWQGDKVLHVTYNGQSKLSRRLVARHWEGPLSSIEVDLSVSRDNQWHSGIVALLREETRRALLDLKVGGKVTLWVDCDVVVPEDAAEALAAHGQALVSGVVPSRKPDSVIARDAFGQPLLRPQQIATEGLRKIAMAGFGCLLMETRLLEKVHWLPEELVGIVDGGGGEDDHLFGELAKAGHQGYLDPQVMCSHYGEDRRGYAVTQAASRRLGAFVMAPQPYSALKRPQKGTLKPRRCLWMMASVGCYGGTKVCWRMMRAMHDAGWEVSVCSLNPWNEGAWTDWSFAKRLTFDNLEAPYDMVVSNYHATLPAGANIQATHRLALIQSDEPEWNIGDMTIVGRNFRTPGYQHVIIANHMREYATKYGHDIVGQLDNGVDTLMFYPEGFLRREWPHSLMLVRKNARQPYSGEDVLDEAIPELAKRYDDLEVVVVGRTDKPRWPCKVRHVQTHDENEMRRLYNSVSCFVRPTFVEGFPLVDLEAMASGCPLVVTPIGIDDVAVDGESALFVAPRDAGAIVAAVSRIFEEPLLREKLARNGVRLTRDRTWEKEQAQWNEIVDKVMAGG